MDTEALQHGTVRISLSLKFVGGTVMNMYYSY
jgi:hypothetical protein